ncbi:hypothetical protein SDC9_209034 [bioreactor metagenome]|uniref:Uncharacterized protein n=1 Tax=bioreactor metagenome TaxID=1076179 RepID=A0A645JF54_9ZZZZ
MPMPPPISSIDPETAGGEVGTDGAGFGAEPGSVAAAPATEFSMFF